MCFRWVHNVVIKRGGERADVRSVQPMRECWCGLRWTGRQKSGLQNSDSTSSHLEQQEWSGLDLLEIPGGRVVCELALALTVAYNIY